MQIHKIKRIVPDSIAEELDIKAGDALLKINNHEIEDIFDYQYLINDEYIEVVIQKINGEEWTLEVYKEDSEDLGIEFENGLMDDYRSCKNKCIFCFIDQMPKGMRETLYFKDDDTRLSFLQGNYVTLTNLRDQDVDRIIKYHLGPINISIHTTNPELRCKMLSNRFAGEALKIIDELYKGRIEMNGQIVLCKGINDGVELVRSIQDLIHYIPYMQSVSVVPSGLTKYREGLFPLEPFAKEDAVQVIELIEKFQTKIYEEHGQHFIHASDEWYILAGQEFPEENRYDAYIQLENGVGMMRLLMNEFDEALKNTVGDNRKRSVAIATGASAYDLITQSVDKVKHKFPNITINIYKIINHYFGDTITVSGLITGIDLINQLKNQELFDVLLLPNNILRSGADVFLDDISLSEVENALQVKVIIVKSTGLGLLEAITRDQTDE